MKVLRELKVPTGSIYVVKGENGSLEMLSLGDYGKDVNIKANFLGLDRPLDNVKHTTLLPLEKKWVVTVSTQYGCSMNCSFCDVPKVGPGRNASFYDLVSQVTTAMSLNMKVTHTERLNVHYARMGEPSWNPHVVASAGWLKTNIPGEYRLHPVVSTMMPVRNKDLQTFIDQWVYTKNVAYKGEAGLQLSINSTDEVERYDMFNGNALTLKEIARVMRDHVPVGRKFTLNFAVAGYTIDPEVLLKYFDPEHYIIKLTPMHKTRTALGNGVKTQGDYTTFHPYQEHEAALAKAGYDVLVFVASEEEDGGRITCGNAILSGTLPVVPYEEVQHE